MRAFIADKFEQWGIDQLKGVCSALAYEAGLKGDELKRKLTEFNPEVLIVRSAKVPDDVMAAAPKLQLIVRAGAGVDNIEMPAASRRGIMVSNCPGMNSAAVAELTIGLMVALDRRIPDNVIDLRAHKWKKNEYSKAGLGLKGRTIGIIGAGAIGTEVAKRALAFEMKVLYYHLGRQRRLVDNPNCVRAELDDLLRNSDVISLHVPGGETTKRLIDERRIGLMKHTAVLINTARGDVLDQEALLRALNEGRIRGAALDVFNNEPAASAETIDSPACDCPKLYGTHHIGASTEQAQMAVAEETVRIVAHFKQSGQALNCVNMQAPRSKCMLVVRFHNKPGGLAHVFHHLAEANINAEEMDHVVYDGGMAAVAHIRIDKSPTEDTLARIRTGHPNVMGVDLMNVD
jgi:D-3-phosphoglycerate dehydrogenase